MKQLSFSLLILLSTPALLATRHKRQNPPKSSIVPLVLVAHQTNQQVLAVATQEQPQNMPDTQTHRERVQRNATTDTQGLQKNSSAQAEENNTERKLINAAQRGDMTTMQKLFTEAASFNAHASEALRKVRQEEGGDHGQKVTMLLDAGATWPEDIEDLEVIEKTDVKKHKE